jgi:hypothetical protein
MLLAGALVLAGAGVVAAALAAGRGHTAAQTAYGQIPGWLPKPTLPVGRVLVATARKPAFAIEGDSVAVRLGRGSTLATAVGPSVPEEGQFPIPETTHCTFTVTFTKTVGTVPLPAGGFASVDERGHVHVLRVVRRAGRATPRRAPAGRTIALTLEGLLPTGNGRLEWTPAGRRPVVSWDFVVEID